MDFLDSLFDYNNNQKDEGFDFMTIGEDNNNDGEMGFLNNLDSQADLFGSVGGNHFQQNSVQVAGMNFQCKNFDETQEKVEFNLFEDEYTTAFFQTPENNVNTHDLSQVSFFNHDGQFGPFVIDEIQPNNNNKKEDAALQAINNDNRVGNKIEKRVSQIQPYEVKKVNQNNNQQPSFNANINQNEGKINLKQNQNNQNLKQKENSSNVIINNNFNEKKRKNDDVDLENVLPEDFFSDIGLSFNFKESAKRFKSETFFSLEDENKKNPQKMEKIEIKLPEKEKKNEQMLFKKPLPVEKPKNQEVKMAMNENNIVNQMKDAHSSFNMMNAENPTKKEVKRNTNNNDVPRYVAPSLKDNKQQNKVNSDPQTIAATKASNNSNLTVKTNIDKTSHKTLSSKEINSKYNHLLKIYLEKKELSLKCPDFASLYEKYYEPLNNYKINLNSKIVQYTEFYKKMLVYYLNFRRLDLTKLSTEISSLENQLELIKNKYNDILI